MSESINLTGREILFLMSNQYHGDYKAMLTALKSKTPVHREELEGLYQKTKAGFLTLLDEDYPEVLKRVDCPPLILYYYGNLSLLTKPYRLTAIGTRTPTLYQADTTRQLIGKVEDALDNDVVIVSGLAKGIDSSAMRAAMEHHAPVIGISGCGIDSVYPKESEDIFCYCKNHGLLLSEYPLDLEPKPDNFVFRNRLVAALGKLLYVGGGNERSGTSSSVTHAISMNKEVFALPCNLGKNDLADLLIREGAVPVLQAGDLVEALRSLKEIDV